MRWLKSEPLRRASAELRQRIDALDEQLVRLLNARAACALEIGRVKKTAGPADLPAVARGGGAGARAAINPGRSTTPPMRRLFERIIDEARRLERIAEGHLAERNRRSARRLSRRAVTQDDRQCVKE